MAHPTGVLAFDLAKNQGQLLWAVNPLGPTLPKESALSRAVYYPRWRTDFVRDGWVWCSSPLSRFALTHKQHQFFSLVQDTPELSSYLGSSLEPVGRNNMLFRHPTGLWLLQGLENNLQEK